MEFAAVLAFKSRFFTSLVVLVESLHRPSYKLWQALGFEPSELVSEALLPSTRLFFKHANEEPTAFDLKLTRTKPRS